MKKIAIITLVIVSTTALMSFKTNKTVVETPTENKTTLNSSLLKGGCWWDETYSYNFTTKRNVACGSESSLKVWFTNPYTYSIRVAFYLYDSNGNLGPNAPYVVTIKPGATRYHHQCYSNGSYAIYAARSSDSCRFPTP